MAELAVDDRLVEGVTVVTVAGQLDVFTVARLRERVATLVANGRRDLVLEVGEVEFCDSTGLGLLAGLHRVMAACEGSLVLAGVGPQLRGVLRETGLTRLFAIYRTVELAVLAHTADQANRLPRHSPGAPVNPPSAADGT